MLPQQYCLRWKYHHSNLQTMFSQLLDRGCFCDVTLACEGQLIRAHRVVLGACSTFFDTVLTNYANERDPIIIMKDANFSDVKCLIEFMYKGEINVEYSSLASLLKTAEDLKIKGLAEVTWREEEIDPIIPMAEATLRTQDDFEPSHFHKMTEKIPNDFEHNIYHKLPTLTPMPSLNPELLGTRRKRGRPPLDESYDVFSSPKVTAIDKIKLNVPMDINNDKSVSRPEQPQLQVQQKQQQHQSQPQSEKHIQLHHHPLRQHSQISNNLVPPEEEELPNKQICQQQTDTQNASKPETWKSIDVNVDVDSNPSDLDDDKPQIQSALNLANVNENQYENDDTEDKQNNKQNNETTELNEHNQQLDRDTDDHDDNLTGDSKLDEMDIGDYKLTDEELDLWKDVIKMDAYLATGRRPQFWEEPFTRRILEAIRAKKLEMKKAARVLGVSYGTLYGRYREVYGCLKHPFRGASSLMSRYEHWPNKTLGVLETKAALPKDTDELWLR